ncbi:MAG: putative bifunctional diguanylate cyclase/phosphodiesterase, partial [Rhodocyclaceae bacterium]
TLRRELISPLAAIANAARRLAGGELEVRARTPSTIDEVAGLGSDFDHMAATIEAAQKALAASEARYRLVAENATDCITWEEPDGHFSYVSPAARRVFGLPPEALLADAEALARLIDPEDQERWRGHWQHLEESAQAMILRLRRFDGELAWIEHECQPVYEQGVYRGRRGSFRDVTARQQAKAEAERLAFHDGLTGLPNRQALVERIRLAIATARRHKEHSALVLLNLSNFKRINDARGEAFGNLVLVAIGQKLLHHLRDGDFVARTYGDEFALLLNGLNPADAGMHQIIAILRKLQETLAIPLSVSGEELTLAACLGITLLPLSPEDHAEAALRRADVALQRAKALGPGEYAFFDEAMGAAAHQRFELEKALHQASVRGELRLYLQSQVDAQGNVVGAECLLRWQNPTRGLVSPAQFIPVAEESRLIEEIGAWVLSESCRLLRRLIDAGRPLRLSVNLSPRQFRQPGFAAWLTDLIAAQGADPALLTLEVTESLAIDDFSETIGRMHAIRSRGIHFSLDDFGTGYSSLAYLKRLPISELKIDKSFILDAPDDADDAALVDTILAVARQLHLRVVAEGVETGRHAAFLDGKGEVIRQGYYYGKPMPAEEWLAAYLG